MRNLDLKNNRTLTIAVTSIMTAIMCIIGPIAIPIGMIPVSLTNLVIFFTIYLLGMKRALVCYMIYLLMGIVGLPVFSGYTCSLGRVFGPTGGYLIGFIPLIVIAGIVIDRYYNNKYLSFTGLLTGNLVCYVFGTLWFAYQADISVKAAFIAGVAPFIILDLVKIMIVVTYGVKVRNIVRY